MQNHKLYIFFGLNFHYLLFFIGFLVRYNRHKSLGMINLMESRPKTYIIKIILQLLMVIASALMVGDWDFSSAGYQFDPLALIYVLYAILWCLSIYLQFFEYQRNLPHVWYAHQMFWVLSAIMNTVVFGALFYYEDISNLKTNLTMKVKYIVAQSVFILTSALLSYMVFKYRIEHPQYLRNYLASTAEALKKA